MNVLDVKIRMAKRRLLSSEGSPESSSCGRSLGIILDSEEEQVKTAFLRFQEKLELPDENVFFLLCGKKRPKNVIFETPYLSAEAISWNGSIKDEQVKTFLEHEFDLLVSFATSENNLAAFAVSVVRANLKVGRENTPRNDFDLIISAEPDEPELFTAELEKYLKILNTAV